MKQTEQELRDQAKKKAEEKAGFIIHFVSYILVNIFLISVNILTYRGHIWFVWPLFGWGVGLIFHFLGVFIFDDFLSDFVKRQTEKEYKKLKN